MVVTVQSVAAAVTVPAAALEDRHEPDQARDSKEKSEHVFQLLSKEELGSRVLGEVTGACEEV
jgi:hypothetical protein